MTATRKPGSGDKSPIFIPGDGPAVLCLHGFTGTPYEVAPLARGLASAGTFVSAPMLAGHGESPTLLAATHWQDWLVSAEAAFDRLRSASGEKPLALAGFSMGGLLALRLARLRPQSVSALVLMSVPLRLRDWQISLARAWTRLPAFLRHGRLATLRKRGGSDVTDEAARRDNPALRELPIVAIAELVDLGESVRRDLTFIKQPTLVAHGERDHTIALQASYELADSLAAKVVTRLWLPRSGHLIGIDVEHAQLAEAVVQFVKQHTDREVAASPGSRPE